jgi:hypothetical protein
MKGLIEELLSDEPAVRNHPTYSLQKETRPVGRIVLTPVRLIRPMSHSGHIGEKAWKRPLTSYRTSPPTAGEIRYPVNNHLFLDSGYPLEADSGMTDLVLGLKIVRF